MDKTGFVSVIGRPNVGKSTLLNRLIGEKISIISNKPQTTRENIQLIYSDSEAQIIFVDTPGMQKPRNKLGSTMLKNSKSSISDMDLILYIVDKSTYIGDQEEEIINFLKTTDIKKILCINKIDQIDKNTLLEVIAMYDAEGIFDEIIPISAIEGDNTDRLLDLIKSYLPEGPRYFPDDQLTDRTNKFVIEEIIREKLLMYLREEIPHGTYVEVDSFQEEDEITLIEATVFTERDNHKGIIIGKNGQMIKKIRQAAQSDIETLLGSKVDLRLWTKVDKNWRDQEARVRRFDNRK